MQGLIDLPTEAHSERWATRFASEVSVPPLVLAFEGDLGAGKTTLIRALLRAWGVVSPIKSPTFSLVESYDCVSFWVHHFDLYRIEDDAELEDMGFRDYFSNNSVCCIEWPKHFLQGGVTLDVSLSVSLKGTGREIATRAWTSEGERLLSLIKE